MRISITLGLATALVLVACQKQESAPVSSDKAATETPQQAPSPAVESGGAKASPGAPSPEGAAKPAKVAVPTRPGFQEAVAAAPKPPANSEKGASDANKGASASAKTPGPDPNKPLERPNQRPPLTVCARACNKAQMCGTASGGVSACINACRLTLKAGADEPDKQATALGFRAQERCADVACERFQGCVARKLLGEKALAASPPLAPAEAQKRCKGLCHKEQLCDTDRFDRRPGGMATCLGTCVQILINPTDEMATARTMMNKTWACLGEADCDAFKNCVRKSVLKEHAAKTPPAAPH